MQLESTNELRSTSELIVEEKCNSESFPPHQNDFILKDQQSTNLIWLPADKHPHISPNEFELWIKTHANETGPNVLVKTVSVKRKKSVLSMVSFLEEESSDDDDEEEEDATPLTPPKEEFPVIPEVYTINKPEEDEPPLGRQSLQIRAIQPNTKTSPNQIPEIELNNNKRNKKHSWFTSLFHKPTKKTSPPASSLSSLPQKKAGLSGLFTKNTSSISLTNSSSFTYPFEQKKKKKDKLHSTIPPPPPPPLITRYPLDIERAVYQLSHIKLNNPRRPLQQQVAISNMMYWYLSITQPMRKVVMEKKTTTTNTTTTVTVPPASRRNKKEEEQQRPTSPTLSEVTTKSNKKKYKPVRNIEYMKK